jgi:hypothetical protein
MFDASLRNGVIGGHSATVSLSFVFGEFPSQIRGYVMESRGSDARLAHQMGMKVLQNYPNGTGEGNDTVAKLSPTALEQGGARQNIKIWGPSSGPETPSTCVGLELLCIFLGGVNASGTRV